MKHSLVSRSCDDASLADQARSVRDKLHHLIRGLDDMVVSPPSEAQTVTADRVRSILRARRTRDRFFDGDLFADPAWDILLELYEAELRHYRLQISSLCIGAAVPPTTALRWIKSLEQRGMLVRTDDPNDRRRVFAVLSDYARKQMDELFSVVPPTETLI